MQILLAGLLVVITLAVQALFLALPTMWLWNNLLPDMFGVPSVTFWQALGFCLLARFLFGSGSSSSSSK
jgi:hypothetical protein